MTDLRVQRRMAADLLDCGRNRIWIDPLETDEVANAITREDIRRLIRQDVIQKREKEGTSRGRARERSAQREKGRQRGPGSREGTRGARDPDKDAWKTTVRALRDELKTLRDEGYLDSSTYRTYYDRAGGGQYDSRRHLLTQLVADGVLSEDDRDERLEAREEVDA
jgi:large subunit ribosomal protein L19e